jgi:hypothetical protein
MEWINSSVELGGALLRAEVFDVLAVADRQPRFTKRACASKQRDERFMQVGPSQEVFPERHRPLTETALR